jgi:hypothetical protein
VRVLVCGSRDWGNRYAVWSRMRALAREYPDAVVVHGAASRKAQGVEQSADMLADAAARSLGLKVEPHPADWKAEPRRAGILRNVEMAESGIDRGLAFQHNGSRGTAHMIDCLRKRGIPVEVIVSGH